MSKKDNMCDEEECLGIENCECEPSQCLTGLEILMEKAEMRRDLAQDR